MLGVVFGAAVDDRESGFALTARQVAPLMRNVDDSEPVATGTCVN